MQRQWTDGQRNAIYATGGSVLVSAAAGSGKTAVLVERVIQMITRRENPIDADRLLVVTFTKDAAAEMKQRISAELSRLLKNDPLNPQLLNQSRLLHTASISTIDSFCGSLVREYFHTLGVAADFRIADSGELELLKAAAMDAAFEAFHAGGTSEFAALLDAFAGKNGDAKLRETALRVAEFLDTQPFPEQWLCDMYSGYGERRVSRSVWGKIMTEYAAPAVSHAVNLTENSIKLAADADEKLGDKLRVILEDDLAGYTHIQQALGGESWDGIVTAIHGFSPVRFSVPRGYADDPIKLAVAANRDAAKKALNKLKTYFCRTEAEAHDELCDLQGLVGTLFDLVRRYLAELRAVKQKKNVLTFSDVELLTVQLLAVPDENGGYIKTEQGHEVSARYDAVIVDEFQDVNDVQNLIFNCVSTNENNLFAVGDVKQSIYGFRQAKPQIFIDRRKSYKRFDADAPDYPATIILDKNFRSRSEVCDTVNFIFSRLMTRDSAQMDYNADEQLNVGATYDDTDKCGTEFSIIEKSAFDEEDSAVLEARYIARRIREIMSDGSTVTKGEEQRQPTYGDFAIMLRSARGRAQTMVNTLRDLGIPAFCEEKESAFDSIEVKLLLNLLRVIDNPARDIPLLSVLCSPMFGFTPDELARLRAGNRRTTLYAALCQYAQTDQKAADFLSVLKNLRNLSCVASVDELVGMAIEASSLAAVTAAVRAGDASMKNLNLIRHYARAYEDSGAKTLSDFIFFIDRLTDSGAELPASPSADADSLNGVRVLSIHKSKGLEFPFCFLAGAAKRFNKTDLHADVLIDSVAGLGIKRRDGVCRYNTLPRLAVEIEIERAEIAEELRVLYVALTRAREKLMIVGSKSNAEKYISDTAAQLLFGSIIEPYTVTGAKSPLDWLTLTALANPSSRAQMLGGADQITLRGSYPRWSFRLIDDEAQLPVSHTITVDRSVEAEQDDGTDYAALLRANLEFEYPDSERITLPQKVSASQIAHGKSGDYFEKVIAVPGFLSGKDTTATERGTAHHVFMQYCDFTAARSDIDAETDRLLSQGFLTERQASVIDKRALSGLLHSELFDRIIRSERVYREERFTAYVTPAMLYDEYDGQATDAKIIMQGAVDLAFVENGRLVIVDYKTDRVRDISKLAQLYRRQLELYREAMRQSLETEVSDCIICSVALGQYISV